MANDLKKKVTKILHDNIDYRLKITDAEIRDKIINMVFEFSKTQYLSPQEKSEIVNSIFNSMRRLDILQPLIDDDEITEIMANGPFEIFIEKNGEILKTDIKFESLENFQNVIQMIVSKVNRTVNESSPIVDARLEDGSRINVVLPPIALNGPILTIRKFPKNRLTMDKLIDNHSITSEAAEFLNKSVKAKYNILISGGTNSGKTSFLNILTNFIPKDERIVTIEDSAELQIKELVNIVRLETRNANTEGRGIITIRDLIKASLRMRPERIIVGEVRGEESIDMLQAMNTGHDGSFSTAHANSAKDVLTRIETMVLSGMHIPLEAIRKQITLAIDIVIHLGRLRDKSRRVLEICEVVGMEKGEIILNKLYEFIEDAGDEYHVSGILKRTSNPILNVYKFSAAGISISERLEHE